MTSTTRRRGWTYAAALIIGLLVAPAWLAGTAQAGESSAYPDVNPMSGDKDAIHEGGKLYSKWCRQCHGRKADGVSQRFGKYSGDLRKFWRGYPEFVVIVLNGRPKKKMPPWGGVLDEDEIAQIAAYLETLAIEGANWKRMR